MGIIVERKKGLFAGDFLRAGITHVSFSYIHQFEFAVQAKTLLAVEGDVDEDHMHLHLHAKFGAGAGSEPPKRSLAGHC